MFRPQQQQLLQQAGKRKQETSKGEPALQAAWVDDDDEQVQVDIEGQARLRKLRKTEQDAVVDGEELQQRLKAQCVHV